MSDRPVLIEGGWVVSMDPAVGDLRGGDVLVENGRIAAVGMRLPASADAERIDAREMIVIPGLIDTHRHTWQSCVRHRYADIDPLQYFAEMLGARGAAYRPEDVRVGTLLGAVAALEAGTTTLLDWSHVQNTPEHADAAIAGLAEAGIRGIFGHGWPLTDARSWTLRSTRPHPPDIRRLRRQYFASDDQLLTLAMAARGPEMTDAATWQADLALARELGLRSTVHVGAYPHNARHAAVRQMHAAGALGPDITFVHCSRCAEDEIRMMADGGVTVSLGVHTEMNSQGIGDIPLDRLLAAGLRPSLSGDTETKCTGDMFTQMRQLLAYYRSWMGGGHSRADGAPATLTTRDVFEFATIRGAEATGLAGKVGSLTPGKQADIVLVRGTDLNLAPVSDPVAAVVLAAHPGNVDGVFVAGKAVKRAGRMLRGDLERLRAAAQASQDYVLSVGG
ncbi:MAG: amidohydrolase family protein [Acetobacteraceae bacterium]|nr:amidohydrolase family protein [Acetobacteraceae bacterium]